MNEKTKKHLQTEYTIDVAQGLIYKYHVGKITAADEMALLDQVLSDPRYHTGMNALCDYSLASGAWSLEELDIFRAYVSRIKKITGQCKWAILFPPGSDSSTARMFVALNDAFEDNIKAKIFTNVKDAMAWLRGD